MEDEIQKGFLEEPQLCSSSLLGNWVLAGQLAQTKTTPFPYSEISDVLCHGFQWLLVAATSSGPSFWLSISERDIKDQLLHPP